MFNTKILAGTEHFLQSILNKIEAGFSKKDHNHDDRYIKISKIPIYIVSRYKKVIYGESWIVTEYSDGYCECEGIVVDTHRQPDTPARARQIESYSRYVDLPVTFKNVDYNIQITNNVRRGDFNYGGGICGYGLPLVKSTDPRYITGKYSNYFVLLQCPHYWSYNIRVTGYKK